MSNLHFLEKSFLKKSEKIDSLHNGANQKNGKINWLHNFFEKKWGGRRKSAVGVKFCTFCTFTPVFYEWKRRKKCGILSIHIHADDDL
jgi:hypothetical protein